MVHLVDCLPLSFYQGFFSKQFVFFPTRQCSLCQKKPSIFKIDELTLIVPLPTCVLCLTTNQNDLVC